MMAANTHNHNHNHTLTTDTTGTGNNVITGIDMTKDRTVVVSMQVDTNQVMKIVDMHSYPQPEGIVDYKIMQDLDELKDTRLAALILMLPAGNNIRELARRVLSERHPYDKRRNQKAN